ncbi:MAG: hypothetical protein AAF387_04825 [Pseudomonadota bacterium]
MKALINKTNAVNGAKIAAAALIFQTVVATSPVISAVSAAI